MQLKITLEEFKKLWLNKMLTMEQLEIKTGMSAFLIRKQAKVLGLPLHRKKGRPIKLEGGN